MYVYMLYTLSDVVVHSQTVSVYWIQIILIQLLSKEKSISFEITRKYKLVPPNLLYIKFHFVALILISRKWQNMKVYHSI